MVSARVLISSGIDQAVADFGVFSPRRYQAPPHLNGFTAFAALPNGEYLLCWSNVPSISQIGRRLYQLEYANELTSRSV